MKNLLFILSNWKAYQYLRKRKRGVKTIDWIQGTSYCSALGILDCNPQTNVAQVHAGRKGIYELIGYKCHSNPWDKSEECYWHLIGYEGCPPVNECSLEDFIEIYKMKLTSY